MPIVNQPQSAAVDPLGNHLFNANTTSSNITNFTVDSSTGALSFIANVTQAGMSVAVDATGEFLYMGTTNPGLASFPISGAILGARQGFQFAPTGSQLRSVAIDPSGKFLYLANMGNSLNSGNIQFSPITAPGVFPVPTVASSTPGNPRAITVVAVP